MPKSSLKKVLKNKTLGIDIDQVLVLSIIPVINQVRIDVDKNFGLRDFKGWNSIKNYAVNNCSWDEKKALLYEHSVWTDPDVLIKSPAMPGAKKFTKELVEQDISFYLITSRIPSLRDSTVKWFEINMPWIKPDRIKVNRKKSISGHEFKYVEVKNLGVDLHIDDSPEHARLILTNTNASVILISNYVNGELTKNKRIINISKRDRLPNMHDVRKYIISS
jgi:5'(3')-deoxyribonucleotidase